MDIQKLVCQFQITDAGDGTIAIHAAVTEQQMEQIRKLKPEILSYLKHKKQVSQEFQELLSHTISQIPGADLLIQARLEDTSSPLLLALQEQYPDAAFALRVAAGQKDPNYDYARICHNACRKLCQDYDLPSIQTFFQKETDNLLRKYQWE